MIYTGDVGWVFLRYLNNKNNVITVIYFPGVKIYVLHIVKQQFWRPFCFSQFTGLKSENWAWQQAFSESAYPSCIKSISCQALTWNALTSVNKQHIQKSGLDYKLGFWF